MTTLRMTLAILALGAAACGDGPALRCGDGTRLADGLCVLDPASDAGSPRDGGGDPSDAGGPDAMPPLDAGLDAATSSDGGAGDGGRPAFDAPITGPVLHVRTDGDDTRCDGRADAPATGAPACAFATIQRAVDAMIGGETVLVHEGVYTEATPYTDSAYFGTRSGARASFTASVRVSGRPGASASSRLTIRAAPGEHAVLDGMGTTSLAFWVTDPAVTIGGLEIRNYRGDPTQDIFLGIVNFFSSPDSEFVWNVVLDPDADAVEDGGGEVTFANSPRIRIEHNVIESGMPILVSVGGSGCCILESDSVIAHNVLVRARSAAVCPTCFRAERQLFGIGMKRQRRVTIEGNYVVNRGEPYPYFSTGIFLRDSEDYVVRANVIEGFPAGASQLWQQDTWPGGANERALILNNVIAGDGGRMAGMKIECSGCVVANNIFQGMEVGVGLVGSGADLLTGAPTVVTHSLFDAISYPINAGSSRGYDVRGAFDVRAAAGLLATGDRPDPYFRPGPGSPAVDAGDDLHCGLPMPVGRCDLGAFELAP